MTIHGDWLRRRSTLVWLVLASIAVPYLGNRIGWPPQLHIGAGEDVLSTEGLAKKSTDPSPWLSGYDVSFRDAGVERSATGLASGARPEADFHQLTASPHQSDWPAGAVAVRFMDFPDILRFDITPAWVLSRWERVTTVVADGRLEGMRVALVTGTRADDIAGSLTYFFDAHRKLQRITLIGHTGDYQRLGQFVQSQFHLDPEPSGHAALWVTRWNGRVRSALLVRHAPVVTQADAHARYEVWLELNLPNAPYRLSAPFEQLLSQGL